MAKDAADAADSSDNSEAFFETLGHQWQWNLYLRDVKTKKLRDGKLETIAKEIYERFVGIPFEETPAPKRPPLMLPELPPAWQLEEFKRRKLSQYAL
jgi:hypothetical protein